MAKQKVIEKVFNRQEASYEALSQWCVKMCDVIRESIVQLDAAEAYSKDELVSDVRILRQVFWNFGPGIKAFSRYKPLVQVDGAYLYGKYKGALLVAVA